MICFKLQAKNLPQASILFFRDFKGLYDKLEMFSRRLLDFSKYRTLTPTLAGSIIVYAGGMAVP